MRFVIQRVTDSSVVIDGETVGKIGKGYLVLIGVSDTDTEAVADKMVKKMIGLRIFEDENGKTTFPLLTWEAAFCLCHSLPCTQTAGRGTDPAS